MARDYNRRARFVTGLKSVIQKWPREEMPSLLAESSSAFVSIIEKDYNQDDYPDILGVDRQDLQDAVTLFLDFTKRPEYSRNRSLLVNLRQILLPNYPQLDAG